MRGQRSEETCQWTSKKQNAWFGPSNGCMLPASRWTRSCSTRAGMPMSSSAAIAGLGGGSDRERFGERGGSPVNANGSNGMANQDHLNKLREGVEAWNQWRHTHPEITPDLSGATLTEAHLQRADLTSVNLRDASLMRANLTEARLSGANLRDANLAGATLVGANFEGAETRGCLGCP